MAPSTLDLFILTFNCAKNLINVPVIADHLHGALSHQNVEGLPDLVVFSLQEVAPLSYSFIGSYFLSPYFSRFEEALNTAASKLPSQNATASSSTVTPSRPYQLVRAKNVGMTAIMLFARTPAAIHHIQEAEVGFGAASMGNKGAVALRVTYSTAGLDGRESRGRGESNGNDDATKTTELTFVATHLHHAEKHLDLRNKNWQTVVSELTFENPKSVGADVVSTADVPGRAAHAVGEEGEDAQPLLARDEESRAEVREKLQAISIYKPSSHLFIAGDLNYRIADKIPGPTSTFPSLDPSSKDYYPTFLDRDQLTIEQAAGRVFQGMAEHPIAFPPSYKCHVLPDVHGAENKEAAEEGRELPWRFAPHRWPSWCDRILYLPVPAWLRRPGGGGGGDIHVKSYDVLPVVRTSDHRAVFVRASVPILSAEDMARPVSEEVDERDPRVTLPFDIKLDAYERRAAARRREMLAGWSLLFWSTREGATFLAGAVLLGVGGWWLSQVVW